MADRRPVLLTVSGRIPEDLDEQVAQKMRPRADYVVMAEAMDADIVDVDLALAELGRVGAMCFKIGGPALLLAWYCFRHLGDYEVIVTDGEQVGLPLAFLSRLRRRPSARHLMIVHILSTSTKSRLVKWARLGPLIDRYLVYCTWQAEYIRDELGVASDHIMLSTFMVDSDFFSPAEAASGNGERPTISTAGLERRDYPTLMEAVDGLDVDVVIAAASPWSKRSDSTEGQELPSNVEVRRLSLFELRDLYARSTLVVMPLEDVEFQAGITTILEAMSMGLPIVCTRTPGQTDTVIDDVTGRYVDPSDPAALRVAIERMLADPDATRHMGKAARAWIVEHADVERYADAIANEVGVLRQK